MSFSPQEALHRTIEHREIFFDEMVDLMRQIMRGDVSPMMTAAILTAHDPHAAAAEWRAVGRLAEARGDHRTAARAWATLGELVAAGAPGEGESAIAAWQRALELDPLQVDALAGLAGAAAAAGDGELADHFFHRNFEALYGT